MSDNAPRWRVAYDASLDIVEAGFRAGREALALRCLARDSDWGGVQCTADAEPAHTHRFDLSDLPGGFVPVENGMDCGLCRTCKCGQW